MTRDEPQDKNITREAVQETLYLRGDNVATLVTQHPQATATTAVLYVHGFSDYYFQEHVAAQVTDGDRGFYAVDLRRYGRSLRDGDVPCYVNDLSEHFEELDEALLRIEQAGYSAVVVMGHSTGGLIVPLWLHSRLRNPTHTRLIVGVVLNSPWFDLPSPSLVRRLAPAVLEIAGRLMPYRTLADLGPVYGQSIHRSEHGEWDFNLDWKPLHGFKIHLGWLRAVTRGQRTLRKGLDLALPVLILTSARSALNQRSWSPAAQEADIILDVADMRRLAGRVSSNVTLRAIPGALHDVFLSAPAVREQAFEHLGDWLVSTAP